MVLQRYRTVYCCRIRATACHPALGSGWSRSDRLSDENPDGEGLFLYDHCWTRDRARHQGEAMLRGLGLSTRNGDGRCFECFREKLWVARWSGTETSTIFAGAYNKRIKRSDSLSTMILKIYHTSYYVSGQSLVIFYLTRNPYKKRRTSVFVDLIYPMIYIYLLEFDIINK